MENIIEYDVLTEEMRKFKTQEDVAEFIKKYKKTMNLPMIMMEYAGELMNQNEYDKAMLMYLEMDKNKKLEYIYDDVTLWFRLGEYYINNGDIEKGIVYLKKICNEISNYEESFEFRGLTADWEKLKPYVGDKIKPSLVMEEDDDKPIVDGELLELLLEELGSGGLHSYLTYYGDRLEETLEAAKRKNKSKTVELLELIKTKYFKGQMPKDVQIIEDIIMENDWWFEEEDEEYYDDIEDELC